MLRPITAADEAVYLQMAAEFYSSDAVDHTIPETYLRRTFQTIVSGSPYAAAYLIECGGQTAGYALLAFTWSQEGGGEVVWIEEVYVRPQFRGHGLGRAFFEALRPLYPQAARFRLEVEAGNTRAKALYRSMGFEDLAYQQMVRDFPLQHTEKG